LLQKTGFQRVKLAGYTGMKSSPHTEGALFSAEKPGLSRSEEPGKSLPEPALAAPTPAAPAEPGGS
jgi:hypothetical protein